MKTKRYNVESAGSWGGGSDHIPFGLAVAGGVVLLLLIGSLYYVLSDALGWVDERFGSVAVLGLILGVVAAGFFFLGNHASRATAREARQDLVDGLAEIAKSLQEGQKTALEGARAERAALAAGQKMDDRVWQVASGLGKLYGRQIVDAETDAERYEDWRLTGPAERGAPSGGPRIHE